MSDDVLIVGAGVGGLTAALSLHEAGFSVRIAEAVPEIRPLGVGINVLPLAARELEELGLRAKLDEVAVATSTRLLLDRFGNEIFSEPLGVAAGYRWPQYSIHRGDLQLLLLEAVEERLGEQAVETGLRFERYELLDSGVRAHFRCGDAGEFVHRDADLLVGADGIHSATRKQMYPDEGPPLWNGVHMWRGATWMEPFLDGRTWILAGSNLDAKLVVYPITPPRSDGRALINWVAEVRTDEGVAKGLGDWQRQGDVEEVLPLYRSWRFGDRLDIAAMIRGADQVWEYPMVDRDPLPAWTDGRVTLLGDAAHPMYPIGANGATQAILDGRYLAWHLWHADGLEEGLRNYEAERRPATEKLVLSNRAGGPERPLTLVAERAPDGFERIEDVLSTEELRAIADGYKATAGFAIQALNERHSLSVARSERSGS